MTMAMTMTAARVAIVAIGRNEGERLRRCLRSIPAGVPVVYVDSGSTDGSVEFARELGVTAVALDMTVPFTAARARNVGWRELVRAGQAPDYVQFIDGDCELAPGWLDTAVAALDAEPALSTVFGRRRERFPERSVYNRMCDEEWDVPIGLVLSCGGDALFRLAPLQSVGGYADDLIAGEEPDLCLRLRGQGWLIRRVDAEMTLHDADILSFRNWWRRVKRGGFAYAAHVMRHGAAGIPDWRRQVRSIVLWGAVLPATGVLSALIAVAVRPGVALAILLTLCAIYLAQVTRIARRKRATGRPVGLALRYGGLIVIGKFAEFTGVATCWLNRLRRRQNTLIEYKG